MKKESLKEAAEIEELLRFISEWIKKKGREALVYYPVSLPQFFILTFLYFKKANSISGLSEINGLAISTTSEMVNRLLQNGFLKKIRSLKDRRVVLLKLTSKGKRIIEKVINKRVLHIEEIIKNFKSNEVKSLISSLEKFRSLIT